MDRNKHTVPYSASDIEKYRKGELSAREMHDLEQAALDDPFLADAIEGLTLHPTLMEDLSDLQERLDQKVKTDTRRGKIRRIQRRIAIAAAFILLLGIGYKFLYRQGDRPQHTPEAATVAANSASPAPPPSAIAESKKAADSSDRMFAPATQVTRSKQATQLAQAEQRHATIATPNRITTIVSKSIASKYAANFGDSTLAAETASVSPLAGKIPPAAVANAAAVEKQKALRGIRINQDQDTLLLGNSSPIKQDQYFPIQNADFKAIAPLVFTGKVLDLQNHPLAGAFLAFNGNSGYGAITDEQGHFRISLHPRDSTRHLTVSLIGYDHASLAVNALMSDNQNDNIIRLRPSTANLDEVVVAGYGMHRKETEVAAPSDSDEKLDTLWTNAAPVIGRQAYLQYLGLEKKKLGLDTTITGTETVSFVVARNGSLSGFKIEQSLSPANDAGILRLVTDGPAWRLIRGKKVRASVTVNF